MNVREQKLPNLALSLLRRGSKNGAVISTVLLIVSFIIYMNAAENVLSPFSMNNLFNNTVALAIASMGLTLVILTGGYDLSIGGIIVLSNVIIASYGGQEIGSVLTSLLIVALVGMFVGAINGFFVGYVGVQSIAVTLATMIMCQGVALVIMPAPGGSVSSIISYNLTSTIGGIPVSAIIIAVFAGVWLVIKNTSFGVYLYAIGEDERSAVQSGIPVRRVKFFSYTLAGVIYSLAGFMLTAQTTSGDPTASSLFLLLLFAAVAIGGTRFGGGKGGAIGSMIGAGILTVLQKMLFALGVSTFYTSIFQGITLILAVLIGALSSGLSKRRDAS